MPRFHLRNANRDVDASPLPGMDGGEGYICKLDDDPDRSLKIFNQPDQNLGDQLEYQINHPPASILNELAWPEDIAEDGSGNVVGYVQRHFGLQYTSLTDIVSPLTRPTWVDAVFRRQCALDAACLLADLHAYDYLFPDLHPDQFLVARGLPTILIDTGSCQFRSPHGLHPCLNARPEYQPPEFLGRTWSDVADQRDEFTDAWSLCVLVFQLAMECHPFQGKFLGHGKGLPFLERATQGHFPFESKCTTYGPPVNAPSYQSVPSELQNLFHKCFVEGHKDRSTRPTAAEWADALRQVQVLRVEAANGKASTLHYVQTYPIRMVTRLLKHLFPETNTGTVLISGLCVLMLTIVAFWHSPMQSNQASWTAPTAPTSGVAAERTLNETARRPADPSLGDVLRRIRRHNYLQDKEHIP